MADHTQITDMVRDMETVEALLGSKGRFVGDMVHVGIKELAVCARYHRAAHPIRAALVQTVECMRRHANAITLLAYTSAGSDPDLSKWCAMQAGDMNKATTTAEAVLKGEK